MAEHPVHYKRCRDDLATCGLCGPLNAPAAWFVYPNPPSRNAVALCNSHALAGLSIHWAMDSTVIVDGEELPIPSAFAVIEQAMTAKETL